MGGIAHQRDAAERPLRDRIAVNKRILIGVRALADQARRNADRVRDPNIKATILTIAERLERLALGRL